MNPRNKVNILILLYFELVLWEFSEKIMNKFNTW